MYTVVVFTGYPNNSTSQYKLSLALGDVPPPPILDHPPVRRVVHIYDAPVLGGNGTLAKRYADHPLACRLWPLLCYVDDVDMYAFQGVAGQIVTVDLPTRPEDYTLTLFDPSGASSAVTYGAPESPPLVPAGPYTVSVSQPSLTPTNEPVPTAGRRRESHRGRRGTSRTTGLRRPPTLVDGRPGARQAVQQRRRGPVPVSSPPAGQGLTLELPGQRHGRARPRPDGPWAGQLGTVNVGGQGAFSITAAGRAPR